MASLTVQFLIHADFVTLPNREWININDKWNQALGHRIPEAVCKFGFTCLKEETTLKTKLVEYIPIPDEFQDNPFLEGICNKILSGLKDLEILLS